MALRALKSGLLPADQRPDPPSLAVKVWGRTLPNPIGLAAGFDKNAEVPDAMLGLGFGLVEIGSVTPRPQDGNPRPRLFRLAEDRGVINRMGFPGQGLDAARSRLAIRPRRGFVGVNVGANKDSTDRAADYVACSVGPGALRRLSRVQRLLAQHAGPAQSPGSRPARRPAEARAGRHCRASRCRCWSRSRPMRRTTTSTTSSPSAASSGWTASSSATRRCRGRRRCTRRDATRPAVCRGRRSRRSRPTCCAAPRSGSKASFPWSAAAASARAPTPMPRSAPVRAWCSSTRRWSSTDRRSSAASRTSSRRCWRATASRPWPRPSASDL